LGLAYLVAKYNELASKNIIELETLKTIENPSKVEELRKHLLEHNMKINREDRQAFQWTLIICSVAGF
jgi:hypothetical protein